MASPASFQHDSRLATQLSDELCTRYSLIVSPAWLSEFLTTVRNPPPPLLALASTANFRLLNSDITCSLSRSLSRGGQQPQLLPDDVINVHVKQIQLQVNVTVQLLDIVDTGSSKLSQVEAIERIERGEEVKGREIIRNVPIMNDEDASGGTPGGGSIATNRAGQGSIKKSGGPHKLLLQDAAGIKVWGFELEFVPKIFVTVMAEEGGLQIGAKILLKKGTIIRRGLVMLEPVNTTVLGGKIEEWDKKWRAIRKERLMDEVKRGHEEQET